MYIIEFEFAALFLNLMLCFLYYPRRSFPSLPNITYRVMVIDSLLLCVTNILAVYALEAVESLPLAVSYAINIIYFLCQSVLPMLFAEYALSLVGKDKRTSKKKHLITALPFCVSALAFLTTGLTGWMFVITKEFGYMQGRLMKIQYIIPALYLIFSVGFVIAHRRDIDVKKRWMIYMFALLVIGSVIGQYMFPAYLIEDFVIACALIAMYMILQNPEESVDPATGCFTRDAFITVAADYYKSEREFSVICVLPTMSGEKQDGVDDFTVRINCIREMADYISGSFKEPVYIIGDHCIGFIATGEDNDERSLAALVGKFNMGQSVKRCRIACLKCPKCAETLHELIDTLGVILVQLETAQEGAVLRIVSHVERKDRIRELESQKLELEERSKRADRAREAAERADREKSLFLANMSHEIRTPMNAIIGMTDLILRDDINDRVRANANDIKSAGDSLLSIINDVLDISRVEAGRMEIIDAPYSLRKMLTDLITITATRVKMPEVRFIPMIDMDLPDRLIGDEVRVRQVLVNILNNAAKFTEHGVIKLKVTGRTEGDRIVLSFAITDTGRGIAPENMDKLFKAFSRIDEEKNRSIEGTGLGLPLSRSLLLQMGGDIKVESEPGRGSTFEAIIPQRVDGSESLRNTCKGSGGKEVLVLCDEEEYEEAGLDREQIENVLEELGTRYVTCTSLEEVIEAVSQMRFSHVLTSRRIFDRCRDVLKESGDPSVILLYEKDVRYDDIENAGLLRPPVYSLGLDRLLSGMKQRSGSGEFSAKRASILVVDDNEVNIKVIDGLLRCYGIAAESVLSGPESIEKASQKHYDIIFMDHMMPGMDGIEAMRHIREAGGPSSNSIIIALTANAVYGAKEMFIDNGFDGYLSKPIDIELLASMLLDFLPSDYIIKGDSANTDENTDSGEEVVEDGLPKLTGVDCAKGLAGCSGNVEKYLELLRSAYKAGIIQREQMNKYYESGNYKALAIELHQLHAMSVSIGAVGLAELTKELERAINDSDIDFVRDNIRFLKNQHSKLLEELEGT